MLIGLSAAVLVAPAAIGLASALTLFAPGPNFLLQLRNWVILSMIVGVPIAVFHAFLIATPAYSILQRYLPLRWWSALLGGVLTGTAPAAVIGLVAVTGAALGGGNIGESLLMMLAILPWLGAAGAVGGLTFWLFVRGDAEATPA